MRGLNRYSIDWQKAVEKREKTMINKEREREKKKIKTTKKEEEAGNTLDYNIECLNMRWAENKTGKVTLLKIRLKYYSSTNFSSNN